MKAIQFNERGGPEVLQLVELPKPEPGSGQVLIKVSRPKTFAIALGNRLVVQTFV